MAEEGDEDADISMRDQDVKVEYPVADLLALIGNPEIPSAGFAIPRLQQPVPCVDDGFREKLPEDAKQRGAAADRPEVDRRTVAGIEFTRIEKEATPMRLQSAAVALERKGGGDNEPADIEMHASREPTDPGYNHDTMKRAKDERPNKKTTNLYKAGEPSRLQPRLFIAAPGLKLNTTGWSFQQWKDFIFTSPKEAQGSPTLTTVDVHVDTDISAANLVPIAMPIPYDARHMSAEFRSNKRYKLDWTDSLVLERDATAEYAQFLDESEGENDEPPHNKQEFKAMYPALSALEDIWVDEGMMYRRMGEARVELPDDRIFHPPYDCLFRPTNTDKKDANDNFGKDALLCSGLQFWLATRRRFMVQRSANQTFSEAFPPHLAVVFGRDLDVVWRECVYILGILGDSKDQDRDPRIGPRKPSVAVSIHHTAQEFAKWTKEFCGDILAPVRDGIPERQRYPNRHASGNFSIKSIQESLREFAWGLSFFNFLCIYYVACRLVHVSWTGIHKARATIDVAMVDEKKDDAKFKRIWEQALTTADAERKEAVDQFLQEIVDARRLLPTQIRSLSATMLKEIENPLHPLAIARYLIHSVNQNRWTKLMGFGFRFMQPRLLQDPKKDAAPGGETLWGLLQYHNDKNAAGSVYIRVPVRKENHNYNTTRQLLGDNLDDPISGPGSRQSVCTPIFLAHNFLDPARRPFDMDFPDHVTPLATPGASIPKWQMLRGLLAAVGAFSRSAQQDAFAPGTTKATAYSKLIKSQKTVIEELAKQDKIAQLGLAEAEHKKRQEEWGNITTKIKRRHKIAAKGDFPGLRAAMAKDDSFPGDFITELEKKAGSKIADKDLMFIDKLALHNQKHTASYQVAIAASRLSVWREFDPVHIPSLLFPYPLQLSPVRQRYSCLLPTTTLTAVFAAPPSAIVPLHPIASETSVAHMSKVAFDAALHKRLEFIRVNRQPSDRRPPVTIAWRHAIERAVYLEVAHCILGMERPEHAPGWGVDAKDAKHVSQVSTVVHERLIDRTRWNAEGLVQYICGAKKKKEWPRLILPDAKRSAGDRPESARLLRDLPGAVAVQHKVRLRMLNHLERTRSGADIVTGWHSWYPPQCMAVHVAVFCHACGSSSSDTDVKDFSLRLEGDHAKNYAIPRLSAAVYHVFTLLCLITASEDAALTLLYTMWSVGWNTLPQTEQLWRLLRDGARQRPQEIVKERAFLGKLRLDLDAFLERCAKMRLLQFAVPSIGETAHGSWLLDPSNAPQLLMPGADMLASLTAQRDFPNMLHIDFKDTSASNAEPVEDPNAREKPPPAQGVGPPVRKGKLTERVTLFISEAMLRGDIFNAVGEWAATCLNTNAALEADEMESECQRLESEYDKLVAASGAGKRGPKRHPPPRIKHPVSPLYYQVFDRELVRVMDRSIENAKYKPQEFGDVAAATITLFTDVYPALFEYIVLSIPDPYIKVALDEDREPVSWLTANAGATQKFTRFGDTSRDLQRVLGDMQIFAVDAAGFLRRVPDKKLRFMAGLQYVMEIGQQLVVPTLAIDSRQSTPSEAEHKDMVKAAQGVVRQAGMTSRDLEALANFLREAAQGGLSSSSSSSSSSGRGDVKMIEAPRTPSALPEPSAGPGPGPAAARQTDSKRQRPWLPSQPPPPAPLAPSSSSSSGQQQQPKKRQLSDSVTVPGSDASSPGNTAKRQRVVVEGKDEKKQSSTSSTIPAAGPGASARRGLTLSQNDDDAELLREVLRGPPDIGVLAAHSGSQSDRGVAMDTGGDLPEQPANQQDLPEQKAPTPYPGIMG